jgi:flagellar motor component MotA
MTNDKTNPTEKYSKSDYCSLLQFMKELCTKHKQNPLALEPDLEDPEFSSLFKSYPTVLNDKLARDFITDTLLLLINSPMGSFDLSVLMSKDVRHIKNTSGDDESRSSISTYFETIKTIIQALAEGMSPKVCLEFGRRSIPIHLRPDASEVL